MAKTKPVFPLTIFTAAALGGCGTFVPNLQEFPGAPGDAERLVHAIVHSVHCELKDAVTYVIDADKDLARANGARTAEWFDNWGMQAALTLTVAEKTEVNPTGTWTSNPITLFFTLGGGVDASSEATRIDTLNFYYTVRALYAEPPCNPNAASPHPVGSLLIQSDLKLREWLLS